MSSEWLEIVVGHEYRRRPIFQRLRPKGVRTIFRSRPDHIAWLRCVGGFVQ